MNGLTRALRHVSLVACTIGALSLVRDVEAQCTIIGPSEICGGGVILLCGPDDFSNYQWTGPNGFTMPGQCVLIMQPGTYTMTFTDAAGQPSSCSRTVYAGGNPPCAISGPTSACPGETVELCGPDGTFDFQWSGPGGFSAADRCVTVPGGGDYQLTVTSMCGGTVSCAHSVALSSCAPAANNCPRPAGWWSRQCRRASHGDGNAGALAAIAGCVDEHSAVFNWSADVTGFCLVERQRHDVRARAKRQFAAVWANVCSADLGMTNLGDEAVGLSQSTPFVLDGQTLTVGEWLAQAESRLLQLESSRSSRWSRSNRREYRQIVRAGWLINHGRGMAPVCGAVGSQAPAVDEESLESEMGSEEEVGASMALSVDSPSGKRSVAISFALESDGSDEEVAIGVYDVSGRHIAELAHGRFAPGEHSLRWDGRTDGGGTARRGIYFVRARVANQEPQTRTVYLE